MNVAQVSASAMLASGGAQLNGGTLVFYAGQMPATPETALAGNTALCTFTFAATAFGTPTFASGNEQQTAAFVNNTVNPVVTGTTSFARALRSDGTTVVDDFSVASAATTSLTTNAAQTAAGTALAFASTTGATVGMGVAGVSIPPGATVAAVTATTVTLTVGTMAIVPTGAAISFTADIVIGNTTIQTGVPVTLSSMVEKLPAI